MPFQFSFYDKKRVARRVGAPILKASFLVEDDSTLVHGLLEV